MWLNTDELGLGQETDTNICTGAPLTTSTQL